MLHSGSSRSRLHIRALGLALVAVALFTGLAAWFVQGVVSSPGGPAWPHTNTLRVGFAIEAPYAFIDAQGRVTGESPEIFRHVAQRVGIQHIDWVRLDFANLLPELQLGRIDAIAAGMFITPERQRLAAFTRPTATVRTALVLRRGETALPPQPRQSDLRHSTGIRWGTVHAAAENALLIEAGVPADRITSVPTAFRGLQAVAESSVDVFAISTVTGWYLASRHPQWHLEVRTLGDAPAGQPALVFRREDVKLRDAVDEALADFLGTDEHRALVQGFGFTSEEINNGRL